MLCKLGNFVFEAKEIESIGSTHNFTYATINRVINHPLYQDVSEDNETIHLQGYYIREKMNKLEYLVSIAKNKKTIRYTTIKSSFSVIIISIQRGRKLFFKDVGIQEEFSITLKRKF